MHKSRLGVVVIDCQAGDFERDIAFWSEALGFPAKRSDDPTEPLELIVMPLGLTGKLNVSVWPSGSSARTKKPSRRLGVWARGGEVKR